ncbi:kinase-like domain-containing protein [Suillus clintonianus]|uniref:kinase-like domain-containing protein n=1 Tax=Suillus clintonianus TaxID=1904413 RepID=UPI001B85E954|nr:kinase-like domain-containing protein [Suillus clintonianus]KAG2116134.1 kinase-like domain-containing protein [Suillus clintonianus]
MSSQSGPDMSTSASANMSTQADSDMSMGLVLKNIQDFVGDLVNQIERLHEFPVSSGKYGEIWQCQLRVESEKVQVAVKSMRLPNVSQPRIRQMLLKEYYVWLKLKHTNIVRFYGMTSTFCVHPAMVTAWMRNGTLTEYLAQQYSYLKPRDRFCLINDVASGLCYLHSNNIIHGDLTGSSVFIDESGRACLADYGLAFINEFSAMNMTASTTDTHHGPNAARWTAPELVLEDSDSFVRPTMSSDIYSFGCIMLQILVGQLPYWWARSSTQVILAMAHKMLPIRDDPNVPRLHEHHVLFLKRCWGPDPHSRPSSADAAKFVAAELRKFHES